MNKSGRSAREILTSACGTPLRGARSFGSETPFTGEQSEASRGTDLVAVPSQQLAEEGPHSEPRLKGNIQGCVGDRKLNTTHQALSLLLPVPTSPECPLNMSAFHQRWAALSASALDCERSPCSLRRRDS